jgi:hypothetical protein
MPRICYFLGISIYMYWNEHQPPHFHAVYGDYAAIVSIETGNVIQGKLSKKVSQLVREWTELHREELLENWQLARAEKDLKKVTPLE